MCTDQDSRVAKVPNTAPNTIPTPNQECIFDMCDCPVSVSTTDPNEFKEILKPLLHIPMVIINSAKLNQLSISEIGNRVKATIDPMNKATFFEPNFGINQAIIGIITKVPKPLNKST